MSGCSRGVLKWAAATRFAGKAPRNASGRAPEVAQSPQQGARGPTAPPLEAPRGADADQVPQQQPEVAAGDLHDHSLQNVRMPAKMVLPLMRLVAEEIVVSSSTTAPV